MSKFDEQFSEPSYFSNGTYVITGKISREEAADAISKALLDEDEAEHPVSPESLTADRVRYGFAPEGTEDMVGELCWFSGATGKGSMPVWVYEQ